MKTMWNSLIWLSTLCYVINSASGHMSSSNGLNKASLFADLTAAEMKNVYDFMLSQKELCLSTSKMETLATNTVFMIELHLPKKRHALRFLDRNDLRPRRQARVVVFFGDQPHPNVTEYVVGPLPYPYYYLPRGFKGNPPITFESRPVSGPEYFHLSKKIHEITEKAYIILKETSGFWYHNCTDRCLTFSDIAPRGLASGERRSWIILQRSVEGFFIHPIGFEMLINHKSPNPKEWTVEKIWYNGQYFDSVDELVEKYNKGLVKKIKLSDYTKDDLFSTYIPRGEFKTQTNIHGPKLFEPQGKRYRVDGNYVQYTGWSFAFRVRSSAGIQLFDIKFNDERIAYEIALQEAIAFYGGNTPAGMQTKYIDAGWGMGIVGYELAKGIDCPEIATYLDTYNFYDTDKPVRIQNAICIFEQTTAVPLRRHFNSNFKGGYNFFGALENHVLVLRTTSTVFNYDYIWDFIFYQNGVMEVKVHATGYIHATFFTPEGTHYGSKVYDHVLGNIHTHLVNYKVDLDIAGRENSFETLEVKHENITNPWSPEHFVVQPRLHRTRREREQDASFPFRKPLPKYLIFYNPNKENKWSNKRGYRIQFNSHADQVLPKGWKEEKGITWGRYHVAVTCHKEKEITSSSIYTQNDPWKPVVYFEDYLRDNQNIINQDLVAWVTVGFLHIPHSEDIPNTATPGNGVGFFLRPFNFFDEDPSLASRSTVIVRPKDETFSEVEIQRWTPAVVGKCLSETPFYYNGTY
uniref:Amine oxidase n=2 Tax=Latimeria chalumnae TaxID=7897 RepID=H3AUM1_LATCH|nr:PREDICTED: amiloride-sensitive amine oxidase [copper-containing] [Latimeria chalumnae]|eukprot:XP_014348122.1 PREDICTED: amiloride-sensitive amine oxidase [copper-containing] [Latimeria chalumnae]